MGKNPFPIPSITESLRRDVLLYQISVDEAAMELCRNGLTFFVDREQTRQMLGLPAELPEPTARQREIGQYLRLFNDNVREFVSQLDQAIAQHDTSKTEVMREALRIKDKYLQGDLE